MKKELYNGAEKFLYKILSKRHKNTVLFIGHNNINKALIAVYWEKYQRIKDIEKQHNNGINIFEIDENKNYKIHVFNCIKHLK